MISFALTFAVSFLFKFVKAKILLLGEFIWPYLAIATSKAVYFLLSLSFSDAFIEFSFDFGEGFRYPLLGVGDFVVKIAKGCSGIEGISLFFALFILIVFLEWKRINKFRAFSILPLGLLGCLFINALRIYLLLVVGAVYSPEFAIGTFHNNIGWILFSMYFLAFEYFTYDWMLGKKKKKKR